LGQTQVRVISDDAIHDAY